MRGWGARGALAPSQRRLNHRGPRGARHFPSAAFGQIFRGLAKSVSLIPGCSAKFWRLLQAVELYRRFLRVLKAELMCSLGREVGAAPACSNVASACYWGAGHSQPCRESWQQAGAGRGRRVGGGGEDAGARRSVLGQQDCCSEVVSVHQVMKPRREETEDRGEVGEVLGQSFCQTMRTFFSYLHVYVLQPSGGSALQDKLGGGCQPW